MSNFIAKTTGVILLAAPFMALAGDTSLTDAYNYESLGAFDAPVAGSSDTRKTDVSTSDMYSWEARDTYEFGLVGTTSSERTEIAVFAEGMPASDDIELPYLRWDD